MCMNFNVYVHVCLFVEFYFYANLYLHNHIFIHMYAIYTAYVYLVYFLAVRLKVIQCPRGQKASINHLVQPMLQVNPQYTRLPG